MNIESINKCNVNNIFFFCGEHLGFFGWGSLINFYFYIISVYNKRNHFMDDEELKLLEAA